MPVRRAGALPLACLLCGVLLACGDDSKDTTFDASVDAAVDAGFDAAFFYELPDYGDASLPVREPTCDDQDCDRMSGECSSGWCNEDTGRCEFDDVDDTTPCGSPDNDDCSQPDQCFEGVCEPNHYDEDSPCGVERICHERDLCSAAGVCVSMGFSSAGTACGDPEDGECDDPDSCDGMGACAHNNADPGAACNLGKDVDCGGEAWPDECSNGVCIGQGLYSSNDCPRGNDGFGNCLCGDTGISPGHICPDECDPSGLCMVVGDDC